MRSTRFALVLALFATLFPALSQAHYTPGVGETFALVKVEGEDGPTLRDAGLFLVAEVPEGYLAFLGAHELDHLRSAGVPVDVLNPRDDKTLEYLVVYDVEHEHLLASPPPGATTLYAGDGYRIMGVPADQIDAQPACVLEVQRVFRRPLSFVRRPWVEPVLQSRAADGDIVAALADITQPPLQTQVQTLQNFVTRHSQQNGGLLASQWIRDKFLSFGYTDVSFHNYNSWNDNVVCVKPGAVFPDEVVVLGAHYDTITSNPANAPGADDNASGSVGVLEAARVLAGLEFERTIVFICFSGEEQGLVGSDAWAQQAALSGTNVVGMINMDMICYRAPGDAEDLDIITNSASQPLADLAFDAMATYVPELDVVDGFLSGGSSDHAAFWAHGFRAIFLFEDSGNYSPFIHSTSDVVGTSANDFAFMLKNARAATATLAVLARPFRLALDHQPLANSEGTGPFPVTAQIVAADPLDSGSLELRYRVDGGPFATLPLVATGQPDEFGATIPAVGSGAFVQYYLSASDVGGYTETSPELAPASLHGFRTGVAFVFREDGELDQGWTLGVAGDNATTGTWIRAVPVGSTYQADADHSPDPGTMCFVTGNANPGDGPGTNDVDGGRTTLLSPVFDLAGATWAGLSYWRWYVDETVLDDDFYVDISNNGGATWQSLEVVTNSAYPWVQAQFDDLGSLIPLTSQMRLRFIAEDIGQGSLVEALIDDLEVLAVMDDPSSVADGDSPPDPAPDPAPGSPADPAPGAAAGMVLLTVQPSPFDRGTTLHFSLPSAGKAELRIYDARGAEVAHPVDGVLPAGNHTAPFDGSELASGTYFARLWLDGRVLATEKLTSLR